MKLLRKLHVQCLTHRVLFNNPTHTFYKEKIQDKENYTSRGNANNSYRALPTFLDLERGYFICRKILEYGKQEGDGGLGNCAFLTD